MTVSRQHTQRHSDAGPAGRVPPGDTRSAAAKGKEGTTMPPRKMWLWFLFLLFINYLLVRLLMPGAEEAITVPYTVFKHEVTKGNVQAIIAEEIPSRDGLGRRSHIHRPAIRARSPVGMPKVRRNAGGSLLIILLKRRARLKRRCPPLQIRAWKLF